MPLFIRNAKDFWSGAIFIGFGLAAVVVARDYPMGTGLKMGPAYFPTVLGALLVLIGVIAVVRSFVSKEPGNITPFAWKGMVLVLASTVLFGLLLRGAGLALALAVLVIASAYGSVKFRWGPAAALAVGMVVFCVLVFVKALGLPIPVVGSWFGG